MRTSTLFPKALFAFLAIALASSCAKETIPGMTEPEDEFEGPTIDVTINAGIGVETKTALAMDEAGPVFTDDPESFADAAATKSVFTDLAADGVTRLSEWTKNKSAKFYAATNSAVDATPNSVGVSTTFDVTLKSATSGTLRVLSPAGTYNKSDATKNVGGFTQSYIGSSYTYSYVVIPSTQTPLAGSCDESVHMVAASMDITSEGIPSEIDMDFSFAIAFGKLIVRNFTSTNITKAVLTFPSAVAGTSCKYELSTGIIDNADTKTLTLNGDNVTKNSDGEFVFWFGLAESSHSSGTFSVVLTDETGATYTKSVTLSSSKTLSFTTGHIRKIGLDMKGQGSSSDDEEEEEEETDDPDEPDEPATTTSLIYASCMEFPAVSPSLSSGQSYTLTGTENDGSSSNKWFRTSTTNSNQYIVTHTFQNSGSRYRNYSMLYDSTKKCALWAAFAMNSTTWGDEDVSRNDNWVYDPALDKSWQPNLSSSYDGSYDRGHQVASNDRQTTKYMNEQTFYFSNMSPQYSTLNQGQWGTLENAVQTAGWACTSRDTMYVVTGPIFESSYSTTNDASDNSCPIPAKYYKCVVKCSYNTSGVVTSASGVAYLTPGNDTSSNTTYSEWKTTIDEVESLTGFDFFTNLPDSIETAVESSSSLPF